MKLKHLFIASMAFLLLAIAGCSNSSAEGGQVFTAAAAKNTDSKINVRMVKFLIEDRTHHSVKITEDLPASPQIFAGLERKEFDFASLFSGEVYNNYFEDIEYTTDPEKTVKKAQRLFGKRYDIKWYDPLGYTNNYSITITQELAKKHDIETISDLAPYASDLRLGTDNAWIERGFDGYEGFQKTYFSFAEAVGMDASLMYKGIANGEFDVITAYTVAPQIKKYNLKVLKDNKQFFPPYQASIVARNAVLEKYPKIDKILQKLVGKVTTKEMTNMMYQVEVKGKSLDAVTKNFLRKEGLLD